MKQNKKIKVWAAFREWDDDTPRCYFLNEVDASHWLESHPADLVVPFKLSEKQWYQLFSNGRIVWANIIEERTKERK